MDVQNNLQITAVDDDDGPIEDPEFLDFLKHKPEVIPCRSIIQGSEEVYSMERYPRGTCLIINNMNFLNSKPRLGSIHDANRLKHIFEAFHFDVIHKDDLTAKAMKNELLKIARDDEKNKASDALVIIILSHGQMNYISGTDGNLLKYTDILDIFSNSNCKSLRGKPKIGFFQACRGHQPSELQPVSDYDYLPCEPGLKPSVKQDNLLELHESDDEDFVMRTDPGFPPVSDFLFSFAAQENYTTAKFRKQIGYYATHLAHVLAKHAHEKDLMEMLVMLEGCLRRTVANSRGKIELCLSSSFKSNGWAKKLFFNPTRKDYLEPNHVAQLLETGTDNIIDYPMEDMSNMFDDNDVSTVSDCARNIEETPCLWIIGGGKTPETLSADGTMWIDQPDSCFDSSHLPVCNEMKPYLVYDEYRVSQWTPQTDKLKLIMKFPKPQHLFSTASINDKIYLIGGKVNNKPTDLCRVYNCSTKEWKEDFKLPCNTTGKTAVVFQDKIYLTPGKDEQPMNKFIMFSPADEKWTNLTGSKLKRYGHAVATCEKYIWIFGGSDGTTLLSDVERFCPGTGQWERRKSMQTARMDFSVAFFKGKFYATGGRTMGTEQKSLDICEIYDPQKDMWEFGPSLNKIRSKHGSIVQVQETRKRYSGEPKKTVVKKVLKLEQL